jgi:hypothetical protein
VPLLAVRKDGKLPSPRNNSGKAVIRTSSSYPGYITKAARYRFWRHYNDEQLKSLLYPNRFEQGDSGPTDALLMLDGNYFQKLSTGTSST